MHVTMKGIEKTFGTNKVLHGVDLEVRPGEVHALVGENGAGKSTLMNILTGVHQKDAGTIIIDDKETVFSNPKEAEDYGISFIHQELNVLPDLTVEENLFLNREIKNRFGFLNKDEMKKQTKEVLARVGVDINPETIISKMSVGNQQLVEISKALISDAELIIMDEPTSALTDAEVERLFEIIKRLRNEGVSVIYISHRMEEIFEISDRITIMRDGRYIETLSTRGTTNEEIVRLMIGRELTERFPARATAIGEVILEVDNLSDAELIDRVSFKVHAGEILGFSGLMGSGRTELMQIIFGDRPSTGGTIKIRQREVVIDNPSQAIRHGIALVTENRRTEGLLLEKSVRENLSLVNFNKVSKNGLINEAIESGMAESTRKKFNIKTETIETLIQHLSGGNQQKTLIAKWILTDPQILILDEPTRGVDVGSKEEIYRIMNQLTEEGIAIIMVSSELPEILGMSDRIAVMHEGKLQGILLKEEADQEKIMTLATGGEVYESQK